MADDKPAANENRSTTPLSPEFRTFIGANWAETRSVAEAREQTPFAAQRRSRLASEFSGSVLFIPAGVAKQRSNDTDFPFRAHSAFSYFTGWASDTVPGSVLVIDCTTDSPQPTLFYRFPAGRGTDEFFANTEIGEFWIGPRPSPVEVSTVLGVSCEPLEKLSGFIEHLTETEAQTAIIREADDSLTALFGSDRASSQLDAALARHASEMRLVKDDYEQHQMRLAIEATHRGFNDVIADLPAIIAHPRGERLVEGTFNRRARADGNAVGYDTIAASGPHACILHWTRNDGPVDSGDLILLDAGVELDSLYTADITRTLPVSGTFTEVQKRVYQAVLDAADAAFAVVKPGIVFREIHAAAMSVIAERTAEWGFLPVSAAESLTPELQYHRRYMVHGTSHHVGIDVHDCAQARKEMYMDGIVREGMVFTIEPGLYFQPDDLSVPPEFRGIGVRIEDNILVTATGAHNLSADIPRTIPQVEAWVQGR